MGPEDEKEFDIDDFDYREREQELDDYVVDSWEQAFM